MSDATTVDISGIRFSSTVFPTAEDKKLWGSLTPAQRLAVIERDEDAGARSGMAQDASLDEIMAGVRNKAKE